MNATLCFYDALSRYYDGIFPVDSADMDFLVGRMRGCGHILDMGCGTGNKTVFFAGPDVSVLGIDSDSGMIDRAGREHRREGLAYEVLDMAEIDRRFSPASFDGVLCLGNTLVHLESEAAIAAFLVKTAELLAPGGRFLLQILNYDRILDTGQHVLPLLESEQAIFRRAYVWEGETMLFSTELQVKESGAVFSDKTPLYPLRQSQLDNALRRAGFMDIVYYGSFQGQSFGKDAFVMIVECRKP